MHLCLQYVPRPAGNGQPANNRGAAPAANGMRTRQKNNTRQTMNGAALQAAGSTDLPSNGSENIPPIRGAKDNDKAAAAGMPG